MLLLCLLCAHIALSSAFISPHARPRLSNLYSFSTQQKKEPTAKSRSRYGNYELRKQLDRVLHYCRDKSTGRQVSNQISLTEVNHAIIAAGRLGAIQEALEIFQMIPAIGLKPDIMSFNNIIWSAGNAADMILAKNLFNELKKFGLKSNVYTYGSLMHACSKSKNPQMALFFLDQMKNENISPNQIVFTSAMEACAEGGKYKEALMIMDRMKSYGIRPDLTMINAAIKVIATHIF